MPEQEPAFETAWAQSMYEFNNYMRAQFAGRWLWIPNAGSWTTTRDTTNEYTNVDGVMIEDFADYSNEKFLYPGDWVTQMDRALSITTLDKILIAQSYPSASGGAFYERQEILASYLLVKGKLTYLNLAAKGEADPGGLTLQWWPDYEINPGPPTDPRPATTTSRSTGMRTGKSLSAAIKTGLFW